MVPPLLFLLCRQGDDEETPSMVLAVAALLLQFQSAALTISAANGAAITPRASVTESVASSARVEASIPAYVTSDTESSSTRLNVASVRLVPEDSKPGSLRTVSLETPQAAQTLSTIRIPDPNPSRENRIERAIESPSRKEWLFLAVVEHGAAGFDAYSTRQAVGHGAVEQDPLMRPFAGSPAIYAATQVGPILFDLLARHMQHSEFPLVRRVWWMPQSISAGISIFSGVHNLNVASSLK
jgi:hypothetical protein